MSFFNICQKWFHRSNNSIERELTFRYRLR